MNIIALNLGLIPIPRVRKRPLHGNEGPNWKLTPARAAQREAVFERLCAWRRAQAEALRQECEQAILRALEGRPMTTTELVRATGIARDPLNATHRPRLLDAGLITVNRVPMPRGGPGVFLCALAAADPS